MSDSPTRPRCSALDPIARRICSEPAIARSLGDPARHEVDYYCSRHVPVAHEDLWDDWFLPGVKITLEITVGASTTRRLEAETEAAFHVADALRLVGLAGSVRGTRFQWLDRPAPRAPRVPARSWARGRMRPVKPNALLKAARSSR